MTGTPAEAEVARMRWFLSVRVADATGDREPLLAEYERLNPDWLDWHVRGSNPVPPPPMYREPYVWPAPRPSPVDPMDPDHVVVAMYSGEDPWPRCTCGRTVVFVVDDQAWRHMHAFNTGL